MQYIYRTGSMQLPHHPNKYLRQTWSSFKYGTIYQQSVILNLWALNVFKQTSGQAIFLRMQICKSTQYFSHKNYSYSQRLRRSSFEIALDTHLIFLYSRVFLLTCNKFQDSVYELGQIAQEQGMAANKSGSFNVVHSYSPSSDTLFHQNHSM